MSALWPETRVDYLKGLYEAQKMTCAEMAADMSFRYETTISRNAVIGKLKRLGLQGGGTGHGGPRAMPKRNRKPASAPLPTTAVSQPPKAKIDPTPVSAPSEAYRCGLLDLTNDKCRFPVWPHGAMTDFLFCGAPGADLAKGVPYCPHCSRIAYRRPGESVAEPSRIA